MIDRPAQARRIEGHPELRRLRTLARLMDSSFRVPGTSWRFGLDPIIGLLPVVGDAASTLVSLYIVHHGVRLGASRQTVARMLANIAADLLIGAVPVLGDFVDFGWKANQRNLDLLERELADPRIIVDSPGAAASVPAGGV